MYDFALEISEDDYVKNFFCELLEDSMDKQEHLVWWERDWDSDKFRSYKACCFALPFLVKNDRNVFARMLRCFCDAEGGTVQVTLVSACECFCPDPYNNEDFVREIVNAAPEMLRKSPNSFGDFFGMVTSPRQTRWKYFTKAFQALNRDSQQVIVDYLRYRMEEFHEDDDHKIAYAESLKLSSIDKGDSRFFWKNLHNLKEVFRGYHSTPYVLEAYGLEFDTVQFQREASQIENENVVHVIKVAPTMLRLTPKVFGECFDRCVLPHDPIKWECFTKAFSELDGDEQQVVIDYLSYKVESGTEDNRFQLAYTECLNLSGAEKARSSSCQHE